LQAAGTVPEQIELAYRLCFFRAPTAEELAAGKAFLETGAHLAEYCQVVLSLNEMIYLN
jgi:hypothetical protein